MNTSNILKIFYFVAWIISAVVWVYFVVKNRKSNGKFLMQLWIALAFMLIFGLELKVWGDM